MQKTLFVFIFIVFVSIGYSQNLGRIDSLYKEGVITEKEYKILKNKQAEDTRKKELDAMLNQGKITQDEYKLLSDLRKNNEPADEKKIRYYFAPEIGPVIYFHSSQTILDYDGSKRKDSDFTELPFFGIEISQGVRFKDKFKAGFGLGYQFLLGKGAEGAGIFPFYLDFNYRPLKGQLSPVISQRIGGAYYGQDFFGSYILPLGLLYNAGIGISINVSKQKFASFSLVYQLTYLNRRTNFEDYYYWGKAINYTGSALGLKAGFSF